MKVTKSTATFIETNIEGNRVDRSQVIQVNEMIGLSDLDELIISAKRSLSGKHLFPEVQRE